jgi:hypothetical protein
VDGNPLSGWGSCDAFGWRVAASGAMVVAGGPTATRLQVLVEHRVAAE